MTVDDAVAVARELASTVVRRNAETVDETCSWPQENLRALQAAGLGGLVVPTTAGGLGHGLHAVAQVCEVLGAACPSTAICFGMHLVGSAVLAAKATSSQQTRYLEPIARGEHLTTLALSEPGTGGHFYIPETRLTKTPEGFIVNGTKSFVTNGGHADSYVISAAPNEHAAAPGEFSCFVVSNNTTGLSWVGNWQGWGMRGNAARSAKLDNARIAHVDLLGEEGDQIWYVFNVVAPFFLVAMAGTYLGAAGATLEHARLHLTTRTHAHTGGTLADNTLIQNRFGTLWAQLQRTRALTFHASRLGDEGDPQAMPALCSAKAEVAEAAERIAADAMTLIGGRGYGEGHAIQRLYRDIRAAHVMAPTTELLRTWTGRALLGVPILGE